MTSDSTGALTSACTGPGPAPRHQLAVSYGRFDVSGWCDSTGALAVWNLRREEVNPCKPDQVALHTLIPLNPKP